MRDISRAAGHEVRRLLHAACARYGARLALVITDAGDLIDGAHHQDDGSVVDLTTSGAIASGLYAAGNQLAIMLGDPDVGSVLQQDEGAQHLLLRLEPGVALVLEAPPTRPLATLRHAGQQLAHALRAGLQLRDAPAPRHVPVMPSVANPVAATPRGASQGPGLMELDPDSGLVRVVNPFGNAALPPSPPASASHASVSPAASPAARITDETDAAFDALFGG
jgi:hypothetical protein